MIAIAGGKGGSGKTTTAVGLAWVLARRGSDPIVVDCDTDMPDIHHLLDGLQPGGIDRLAAGQLLERACAESPTAPGVRCLTAGDRSNVADALIRLTDWHDTVILDCPPGAGPDAVRPLRHAQRVLLVSTDQPSAVTDTVRTARTARELGTRVFGAILRETPSASVTEWPDESPLLARVESVEAPLEDPQVRAEWSTLAASGLMVPAR
ncbi:MinD/ParA family ATP-binding protein [Halovenus halobia]|uniref:MinD/ParA family ATP-binding protein n=1 Tax=Halovenus halobia TaxID=3396622 RepID=UPI003F57650C